MSLPGQFDPARQRRANDNFRLDQQFLEAPLVVRNGKIALALDPASALYPGQQGLQVLVDGETMELVAGSPIRLRAIPQEAGSTSTGGDVAPHASTHENGGTDEIGVAGLSGLLADPQTPLAHAASHKDGGADVLLLHEFGDPTASVEFAQQQALQFRLENRAADPGAPADGQMWMIV